MPARMLTLLLAVLMFPFALLFTLNKWAIRFMISYAKGLYRIATGKPVLP